MMFHKGKFNVINDDEYHKSVCEKGHDMNENVKIKLKTLKKGIANIQSYCECILKDIENVDVSEDMYVIAHNFDMIRFTADDAFDYSYQTMNLFEEEKK